MLAGKKIKVKKINCFDNVGRLRGLYVSQTMGAKIIKGKGNREQANMNENKIRAIVIR